MRGSRLATARILIAVAALIGCFAALPAQANDEWPKDTVYSGPMHFCSARFATDVAQDEKVTVRDAGLDFLVTYFEQGEAWTGVYEGNHPSVPGKTVKRVKLVGGQTLDRLTAADGSTSYLVTIPVGARGDTTYLHIFGSGFTGNEGDMALLDRFVVGDVAQTGCTSRTYELP